jgi:hypothetical protein
MPPKKTSNASASTPHKQTITFLVVEKNGDIKETEIKRDMISPDELAKRCKFKKFEGFCKRTEWGYNIQNFKIVVEMWAKDDGIANQENKYEFPPPLDHDLYFGACVLIAHDTKNDYVDLTESLWDKIYEHLFGGFESLVATQDDDDDEEDELDKIPNSKKTKHGYLKDGFVVDGGINSENDDDGDDHDDDDDDESDDNDTDNTDDTDEDQDINDDEDDESDMSDESEENMDSDDNIEDNSDDSDGNKVKKNKNKNKKNNVLNNKHTNSIVKIKQDTQVSSNSSNKNKKIDVILSSAAKSVGGSITSNRKRNVAGSLSSNSKLKSSNTHTKNIKSAKIEEELCDDSKSYDSSELSEEDYTYKI